MSVDISVTISNDVVSVDNDPAKSGKGPNIPFKWTIVTQGWTFTDNGIDIAGNDDQFKNPSSSGQGKHFHWLDRNNNTKTYKYTVNVTNGAKALALDPAIENQGEGR